MKVLLSQSQQPADPPAAFALSPSAFYVSSAQPASTMEQLNFAMIGCGALAKIHVECVHRTAKARFTAFCDVVPDAAESLRRAAGGDYATTDVARALDDARIHAVYICTRHDSHAPIAIAAARAGKHILIEKPLALTLAECETIDAEVRRAGVHLMPAFKLRYYPLIQKAREFIPNPQVLVGQMMDNRWPDDFWAQDPVQGGANVFSQGCHMTDILRHLAGSEPGRIWAAGGALSHPGHKCIDQCVAAIEFANGHVASWIQGDAATGGFTSKFFVGMHGDGRSVQLHDRLKQATFIDGQRTWSERVDEEEGFYWENVEFVNALREGRPPALTAFDGIQATRMVLAADAAIRTGEVQDLIARAVPAGERAIAGHG
jgi:predicted dehydrogenase